jgi:hypothetical protein
MKKIIIGIIILLVLLSIALVCLKKTPTAHVIKEPIHTYTKAICNSTNHCQDYVIECEGNKTLSVKPITGAVIQFDENWRDPRTKRDIERFCN